jgi:hypothetical protein
MLDIENDPIHQVCSKCVYPSEKFDGLGVPMLLMKVSSVGKEPLTLDHEHRVLDNDLFDKLFAKVESHRTPVKRKSVKTTQKKRKSKSS